MIHAAARVLAGRVLPTVATERNRGVARERTYGLLEQWIETCQFDAGAIRCCESVALCCPVDVLRESMVVDALQGITTPLVTPFGADGIAWEDLDRLLGHVVDAGVDAVFPCGTTGEVASLSQDERADVIAHTVGATPESVPVLAGGTGTVVSESIDWLHRLDRLDVDGAVVTAPFFHPANDPSGLCAFFDRLATASPIPLLLYNIPACVGTELPVEVVAEVATRSNVIGLKDSSGDLEYGLRVAAATPDEFLLLQGYDPLLVPSLRMGLDGGVNALSNVFPAAYREIVDDPGGPRAEVLHAAVIEPLFAHCRTDGFATVTKAGLAQRDVLDTATVRPPLVALDPDGVGDAVDRGARAIDS